VSQFLLTVFVTAIIYGLDQGWRTYGTRAQSATRDFLGMRHVLLSEFFPDQTWYIVKWIYIYIYAGLQVVYDYHYYQMKLRVKILLYKAEVKRRYWLPKQSSKRNFQLFCYLSLPVIIFKITIMIYKYNNNDESRHQYQSLLLKTPMGTQKKLIRKLFTIWSRALKRFAIPGTDSRV
jgi:hypothetical protein